MADVIPILFAVAGIAILCFIIRKVLGDNPYMGTGCGGG